MFDDSPVQQRGSEDGCLHDLMSEAMNESSDNEGDSVDGRNEVLDTARLSNEFPKRTY